MKTFKFIIILFVLYFSPPNYSNGKIVKKDAFRLTPNEIIYLQTNRNTLTIGDTLWFKAYVLDKNNLKISYKSNFLTTLVVTKNGKIIWQKRHKLNGGFADGYIPIPINIEAQECVLIAYPNLSYGSPLESIFSKKIRILDNKKQEGTIFLSIPDSIYKGGDEISGKLEIKNAKGSRFADITCLLQIKQDTSILIEKEVNTGPKGISPFKIKLPDSLLNSALVLDTKVITEGLESKLSVSIAHKKAPPWIGFFPESGVSVSGIKTKIAFKALDIEGNPFDFEGSIINKKGELLKNIETEYMGMGVFELKYNFSDELFCKMNTPSGSNHLYPLPMAQQNAYNLKVIKDSDNLIKLSVLTDTHDSLFHLQMKIRNKVWWKKEVNTKNNAILSFSTKEFPMGVATIQLFKPNGTQLAERLIFINRNKKFSYQADSINERYKTNEKVKLQLNSKLFSLNKNPSNLSVSVSYLENNKSLINEKNILSSIYLENELKGEIPTPGIYFSSNPMAEKALDLLLLTNGWRKIIIPKSSDFQVSSLSIGLQGKVLNTRGKPIKQAEISLVNFKTFGISRTKTDKNGHFAFSKMEYIMLADTNKLVLNATGPQNNKKVKIELDNPYQNYLTNLIKTTKEKPAYVQSLAFLQKKGLASRNNDSLQYSKNSELKFNKTDDILVGEVEVNANRLSVITHEVYEKKYNSSEIKDDAIILVSGNEQDAIFHMIQKTAGTFKVGDGGKIFFRGNNSIIPGNAQGAIIVIDGVYVGSDWRVIGNYGINEIQSIKVTKNPGAGMKYTSNATAGVIEITLKKGTYSQPKPTKKDMNITYFDGYQAKKEFYCPKYINQKNKKEKPDLRKTIYWNPSLKPNKEGKISCEFYTSDIPGNYIVKYEGIGNKGELVSILQKFKVENE